MGDRLLEVNPAGWRCSLHWHRNRWNLFAPIDARIVVETFGPADDDKSTMPGGRFSHDVLGPGDSMVVRPFVWHRFRTLAHGRVVEVYWTTDGMPVRCDDIVRWDAGGPDV